MAMITLALGIGANSAIFTVTYAVLLKPLPYERPRRSCSSTRTTCREAGRPSVLAGELPRLPCAGPVVPAGSPRTAVGRSTTRAAARPSACAVSRGLKGFSRCVNGTPAIGSGFRPTSSSPATTGRDHRPRLLAARVWRTRHVLNSVDLVERPAVHHRRRHASQLAVWRERHFGVHARALDTDELQARGWHYLGVIGRLKPGVTIDRPAPSSCGIASQTRKQYPAPTRDGAWSCDPCSNLRSATSGRRWRCSSARSGWSCSWPARTWRTCIWRAPRAARGKWPSGQRSAPAGAGSCSSC